MRGHRGEQTSLPFCVASRSRSHHAALRSPGERFEYGTAGFRCCASRLACVAFRCGALAAARSASLGGAPTGLVVTASHNPEDDNGIKLVDPSGEMLSARVLTNLLCSCSVPLFLSCSRAAAVQVDWEATAEAVVNSEGSGALRDALSACFALTAAAPATPPPRPTVLVARDTRPSGEALLAAAQAGAASLGADVHPLGQLTTPSLHLAVHSASRRFASATLDGSSSPAAAQPTHASSFAAHVNRLAAGFSALVGCIAPPVPAGTGDSFSLPQLQLDCAHGVGAAAADAIRRHPLCEAAGLSVGLRCAEPLPGRLNAACGADFVQKRRVAPDWSGGGSGGGGGAFGDNSDGPPPQPQQPVWCASLDGDADRIVFYSLDANGRVARLIDGDKTAALVTLHLAQLLAPLRDASHPRLSFRACRTAYANGAVGSYLAAAAPGAEQVVARTGVKHLAAAAAAADVGVYWEANGHGSVHFSAAARGAFAAAAASPSGSDRPDDSSAVSRAAAAAAALSSIDALVNPAVGDALSTLLLVIALLRARAMTFESFDALYADLPSAHRSVRVPSRSAFVTAAHDEQVLVSPAGCGDAIAAAVRARGCASARAFARPSGTEDLVRVYAEAGAQGDADELADAVAAIVVAHA